MRVMGSNFGDFDYEILIQTSDWKNKNDTADQLNWCVGVLSIRRKFYWTQSMSKAGKGRIFRANIETLKGQSVADRTDIELLLCDFQNQSTWKSMKMLRHCSGLIVETPNWKQFELHEVWGFRGAE
jgi:hypothetical protein